MNADESTTKSTIPSQKLPVALSKRIPKYKNPRNGLASKHTNEMKNITNFFFIVDIVVRLNL